MPKWIFQKISGDQQGVRLLAQTQVLTTYIDDFFPRFYGQFIKPLMNTGSIVQIINNTM